MEPVVVSLSPFLSDSSSAESREACASVARSLKETGIVILQDPRISKEDNEDFLDLLEDYFAQDDAAKQPDERPQLHYQVGTTPANVEIPICTSDEECLPLCLV